MRPLLSLPSCPSALSPLTSSISTTRSGGAGRGKGYFPTLSTYMLSSGATFAFFMSSASLLSLPFPPALPRSSTLTSRPALLSPAVGTVIRTDGLTMQEWAAQQVREGRAVGMPGVIGAQAVRERMERREKP